MARSTRDEFPPSMSVASALALILPLAGLAQEGEDGGVDVAGAVSRVSQTLLAEGLSTVADLRLAFDCVGERRLVEVAEMLGSSVETVVCNVLTAFLDKLYQVGIEEYALPAKRAKRVVATKLLFGAVVPDTPLASTVR